MNQISATTNFSISTESIKERRRNILWGFLLSLLLAGVVAYGRTNTTELNTDGLFLSVVVFLLLANLINYLRHRRYLRLIRNHRVEIQPGRVEFWTRGNKTVLDLKEVAAMNLYRRRRNEGLRLIQLRLKNNRGIRLEGYGDLEGMAAALAEQIPKAHIKER